MIFANHHLEDQRMKRIGIALALIGALLVVTPSTAMAHDSTRPNPNIGMKLLDVLLVRPLMVPVSIVCTAVGLPLTLITWPIGVAPEVLTYTIVAPWRFTSTRYVGDFRNYEDGRTITDAKIQD